MGRRPAGCAALPGPGQPPVRTGARPPAQLAESQRPRIDPQNRGVANAVVFLRGVDPHRARPWDLDPARVELRDYQIHIRQGDADGAVGFVHRGDRIDLESKQNVFHSIQARGADFFALTFPDEGAVRNRVVNRGGLVELCSNAGQFSMRPYLFVDDHPYYARTAADGRYAFAKGSPGDYDLVCWLPDSQEASHEIDADTRLVTRLTFRPPREVVGAVSRGEGDGDGGLHAVAGAIRRRQTLRPLNRWRFSTGSRSVNGPSDRSRLGSGRTFPAWRRGRRRGG